MVVKTPQAVGAGGVLVSPDDLAGIIDAVGAGAAGGQGIVEGGVSAVARIVDEAVAGVAGIVVMADDLARRIDAVGKSAPGARRIVEGGESAVARIVDEAVGGAAG